MQAGGEKWCKFSQGESFRKERYVAPIMQKKNKKPTATVSTSGNSFRFTEDYISSNTTP